MQLLLLVTNFNIFALKRDHLHLTKLDLRFIIPLLLEKGKALIRSDDLNFAVRWCPRERGKLQALVNLIPIAGLCSYFAEDEGVELLLWNVPQLISKL